MTIVETQFGKVKGITNDGVHSFKGIPFAAPPTGQRRWHPPAPPEPWAGLRDATDWGKQAWQQATNDDGMLSFVFNSRNAAFRDEDCLQLNIWTKGADEAKRPVLVWIHGGGFGGGTGGTPTYAGHNLSARGDVVVVTINYRVGPLGFLNLSKVTNGRIPATGNEGILDQIQALKWIRDNITAFGGDPNNVTIFGESAGGMSIGALLAIDSAKGLFHHAMAISGAASVAHTLPKAVEMAEGILGQLELTGNDVEKIMLLEPETLIDAATKYRLPGVGMMFQPIIDGRVIKELPIESIKKGSADGIDVLAGTQRDEWLGFTKNNPTTANMDEQTLIAEIAHNVADADDLVSGYRKIREARGADTDPASLYAAIETDRKMRMPAIDLLETLSDRSQSGYHYIFGHESPWDGGTIGAPHAIIIGFVFGTHAMSEASAKFFGKGKDADTVSNNLQDTIVALARTGNPRTEALTDLTAYDTKTRSTAFFATPTRVESAPFEEERALWEGREVSEPFGAPKW